MVIHPKSDIDLGDGGDRTSQRCGTCVVGTDDRTDRLTEGIRGRRIQDDPRVGVSNWLKAPRD